MGVQPRRRVHALVLFRSETGDVLLVKPSYRPDWLLPGGEVRPGVPIGYAVARELVEELGLQRSIVHALAVDQSPANLETRHPEGLTVVCDGGLMNCGEAVAMSLPVRSVGIEELAWVSPKRLPDFVAPFMECRIRAALAAVRFGVRMPLPYNGESAD
ncbi:NUDIX domain-containing protein [Kitasatospora sp. MBT66]|uniref:NUDIX domain-containing protein n=1 Tax=Kitasatospora sp. MBT66 TaxID=1444769 RepID=UPI00068DEDEE|nr:NUDIX domain-containing protein [Kitasatospora sp. MBT66]